MTNFGTGRAQQLPPVVKNIIIINCILAALQFVLIKANIDLADILGLHYWRSDLFRPWQLVTHMFMHGSAMSVEMTVMHLFSNMFGLWMFGSILENVWGAKKFLTFYLICGLGAAVLHLAVLHYEYSQIENAFNIYQQNPTLDQFGLFLQKWIGNAVADPDRVNNILRAWNNNPGDIGLSNQSVQWVYDYLHGYNTHGAHIKGIYDEATVGASGAVFGVLFAFGYLYPNTPLMMIFIPIPVKAKYFIALYAVFELYSGIRNSAGDNVAHFAHLGGMLVAYIILKMWSRSNNKRTIY